MRSVGCVRLLVAVVLFVGAAGVIPISHTSAAATTTSRYTAVAPARLYDTRPEQPIPANTSRDFQITGGVVPSDAAAVVVNVTATESQGNGWLQVFPTGQAAIGTSSTLNLDFAGQTIPNASFAPIGDDGKITVFTTFTTDVLIDVFGYFVPADSATAGRLVALPAQRLLDTRSGIGWTPPPAQTRIVDGDVITLQVTGSGGVPATGVSAVVLNTTAVSATAPGFVQVAPTPVNKGAHSNLNPEPGRTIANLVVVPVGAGGTVDVYTDLYVPGAVDLLADVVGYFTDGTAPDDSSGLFVPIAPDRQLDTRQPAPQPERPSGSITDIDISDIAPNASAIAGNLTSTGGGVDGYLQLAATPIVPASASSLNTSYEHQTIANAVVSSVGVGGLLQVYSFGSTHELLDVTGWFTGGSSGGGGGLLGQLVIAPQNTTVPYDRDDWPHWIDADGDCQDTRAEALIRDSQTDVTFRGGGTCTVTAGQWLDPWTNLTFTVASDVDIDHTVALANAHRSGAWAWSTDQKRAYANDLANTDALRPIDDGTNVAKSAKGPEEWKPPFSAAWCDYATDWATIKIRWSLTVTQSEYDALTSMLTTC